MLPTEILPSARIRIPNFFWLFRIPYWRFVILKMSSVLRVLWKVCSALFCLFLVFFLVANETPKTVFYQIEYCIIHSCQKRINQKIWFFLNIVLNESFVTELEYNTLASRVFLKVSRLDHPMLSTLSNLIFFRFTVVWRTLVFLCSVSNLMWNV